MEKKIINKKSEIDININKNIHNKLDTLLLNLQKFKLYPPPIGSLYVKPNIYPNLNFSILEPILLKEKKP